MLTPILLKCLSFRLECLPGYLSVVLECLPGYLCVLLEGLSLPLEGLLDFWMVCQSAFEQHGRTMSISVLEPYDGGVKVVMHAKLPSIQLRVTEFETINVSGHVLRSIGSQLSMV